MTELSESRNDKMKNNGLERKQMLWVFLSLLKTTTPKFSLALQCMADNKLNDKACNGIPEQQAEETIYYFWHKKKSNHFGSMTWEKMVMCSENRYNMLDEKADYPFNSHLARFAKTVTFS